jgi:hypothetical protein
MQEKPIGQVIAESSARLRESAQPADDKAKQLADQLALELIKVSQQLDATLSEQENLSREIHA